MAGSLAQEQVDGCFGFLDNYRAYTGDDSGQVTSAGQLHLQVTSAIDNFGY
jgi:hypothetical protein